MACKEHLPTKCCCGCSLRTGAKIIVLVQIIFSLIMTGILFTELAIEVNGGLQSHKSLYFDFYIFFGIQLAVCICNILICVLLIYGISINFSSLIIPWLIVYAVINIVGFILSIANIAVVSTATGDTAFVVVFFTLIFVFQIYFWTVLLTLYYQIRGEIPTPY